MTKHFALKYVGILSAIIFNTDHIFMKAKISVVLILTLQKDILDKVFCNYNTKD